MAGKKDIVNKALKVVGDYFAPSTDEYAKNLDAFFGGTDPNLRRRLYTGTSKDKDFPAFQESRHGTWLTANPEEASDYALQNDSQSLRMVPGTWNYEPVNSASRIIPTYARVDNPYRGELPDFAKVDNYKKAQSDWFDKLRAQGYDAWVPDSRKGEMVVVLKDQGNKVKSAIGNAGTFDLSKKHMNKAEGGSIREGYQTKGRVVGDIVDQALKLVAGSDPQKTVKAYKLFKQREGKLYPLFVDAKEEVPVGQWLKAKAGDLLPSGKVKAEISGGLAYRPGWHAGDLPTATHIGAKSHGNKRLPPDTRRSDEVWAEVDMADDVDWQKVADERARITKKGTPDPKTAHITDQVPYGGFYRYKTSPTMQGNWMIGGDMRVNRILTDDEVKAINDAAGVADLPRREGYGPGGWVDDVVKMAGKAVMGGGEKAVGITPGTFPGKKLPRVDALANNVDKFVYHSGLAENVPDMKYGIDPQIGPWVRENLESDVDEEHLNEILENAVPVAWWSKQPDWAVVKVARKLNKTVDQVTPEDLAAHGHVAMIPKKDPEAEHLYWMGEEGLNNGPYSEIEDITGKKVKAYNTDLYSNNYGPEGVERNEYVTTRALEPYLHLTGNELLDFLRKTGAYDKAYGGRTRGGNNSISGALNVARGMNGGK